MVKLDILSDPICPWCYIGKANLDRALEAAGDHPFEIEWHPFQLNPDMDPAGMDRREYLETKFGGAERAQAIYARVSEEGAKEALPFAFDAIPRTPNTLESHRLVRWAAAQPQGQDAMVEALFQAYFRDGEDVSASDTLVAVAAKAGFDADAVRAFLESGAERDAVWAEDQRARNAGITGVPCFILDGRVAVPGAVEPQVMLDIFDQYHIGQ